MLVQSVRLVYTLGEPGLMQFVEQFNEGDSVYAENQIYFYHRT